ncbi:hypothetical protein [Protofrankia coriariae]|nr:hypothetical protein [Protofrankia coriariae]
MPGGVGLPAIPAFVIGALALTDGLALTVDDLVVGRLEGRWRLVRGPAR